MQVDLEYEIDAREIPNNFSTGWFGYGTYGPGQYPTTFYGSEVYELNTGLRDKALAAGSKATLNDTIAAQAFRALFPYAPANAPPVVQAGDVVSSNVYFTGVLLSETCANWTKLWTNGTGEYCATGEYV